MMNTAKSVDAMIEQWKAEGRSKTFIVWNTALACVGWSYVYSAWGAECTPAERRKRYRMCPGHETIKTKCKAFEGGDCSGCQWFPGGERTRCFDCRGFTDWCLNRIGFDLYGDTCSAQWNHGGNWKDKGEIASMPKDTLCCLFVYKNGKWTHTGFGFGNETVECSSGVQHFTSRNKKWTHWAIPAGLDGDTPTPAPTPQKPTLRKGSTGEYVTLLQTELINRGYSCGSSGADGKFGAATEKAVKAFQQDHGLTADGICGPMTWKALDNAEPTIFYTVTVPHLTQAAANQLLTNYPGSTMTQE
jgi:hypothetical protein